ncbi:MAG: hypothetical protein EOO47_14525 [Flavobacterium sp.]|nr:MAG: hypothetical protein EOO47_14525 [Flavobacterium sp.]
MKFTLNKKLMWLLIGSSCSMLLATGFSTEKIYSINSKKKELTKLTDSITYSATGYTTLNKDKSIITLHGGVKFKCEAFSISANEIIFNKKTEKIIAKNFAIKTLCAGSKIRGDYGEFSINKFNQ